MHSNTSNVKQLRADLRNGPNHVFNDHTHCSTTFCKVAAKTKDSNQANASTPDEESSVCTTLDTIISEELEQEVQIHNEEDESRGANPDYDRKNIPDDLFFRIQRAGDRLVSMASELISNSTSNLAESFMNIRCKFDGGKFYRGVPFSTVHMVLD